MESLFMQLVVALKGVVDELMCERQNQAAPGLVDERLAELYNVLVECESRLTLAEPESTADVHSVEGKDESGPIGL